MKITQISIFVENKQGRLYDVASILGANAINIRALTVAEEKDFGVLRMVTDQPEKTLEVLKKNGFVASLTEIVALEVNDEPGGLAAILKVLTEQGINVEYMYGFVEKFTDKALLVFRFDDPDKAIAALKENGISVVGKTELKNL
jgi:hypothetical protein